MASRLLVSDALWSKIDSMLHLSTRPGPVKRFVPSFLVFALFLIFFLLCYASVLSTDYGFFDDYPVIDPDSQELRINKMISEGRPLYALITHVYLQMEPGIEDLRYARLFGIFGISLLGLSLFNIFVREGCDKFQSFCVGVIICSTLPMQVYVAWGITSPFPFAAFISGFAFLLCNRAFDEGNLFLKLLIATGSILMMLIALLIYQSAAMFFWCFSAIFFLMKSKPLYDIFRRLAWSLLIFTFAMSLGLIVYKLGTILTPNIPRRGDFVQNIPDKVVWFLSEVLPNSLNFSLLSPSSWFFPNISTILSSFHRAIDISIAGIVAVIIAGGLVLYFQGTVKERLCKLGIAASLMVLSYSPNLIVENSYAAYRTLSSITSVVVIYVYLAFRGYIHHRYSIFSSIRINIAIGCVATIFSLLAAYHVYTYFVAPQARELAIMRSQLAKGELSQVQSILVVRPDGWKDTLAPLMRYDEFGMSSSSPGWTIPHMVRLILRETAPKYVALPVIVVSPDHPTELPFDSFVVGMRNLKKIDELLMSGRELVPDTIMPIIRSRFDVYLNEKTLRYIKRPCIPSDTKETFFLHIIPSNVDDLPDYRRIHGFDNLDFEFFSHGVIFEGTCTATFLLPQYTIAQIRTGQYLVDEGKIWDAEFSTLQHSRDAN